MVVKNGSNMSIPACGGRPTPESATDSLSDRSLPADTQQQDSIRDGGVGHRFTSVDDQVYQQLQQLNLIAAHGWQSGRDIRLHAHARDRGGLARQGERVLHDRFQRDGLALCRRAPEQGSNASDDFSGLPILTCDVFKDLSNLE